MHYLGAANMRDIGFHFPDTSADFKDADSKLLAERGCAFDSRKRVYGWQY